MNIFHISRMHLVKKQLTSKQLSSTEGTDEVKEKEGCWDFVQRVCPNADPSNYTKIIINGDYLCDVNKHTLSPGDELTYNCSASGTEPTPPSTEGTDKVKEKEGCWDFVQRVCPNADPSNYTKIIINGDTLCDALSPGEELTYNCSASGTDPTPPSKTPCQGKPNPAPPTPASGDESLVKTNLTKDLWDEIFSNTDIVSKDFKNSSKCFTTRFNNDKVPSNELFTYDKFIDACNKFPAFGKDSNGNYSAIEIAAFLANAAHETGNFCFGNEQAAMNDEKVKKHYDGECTKDKELWNDHKCYHYDYNDGDYVDGKKQHYYGRGALQLSWCYNYFLHSRYLEGAGISNDIFKEPDSILDPAPDNNLAWATAISFWMNNKGSKTDGTTYTCHTAIQDNNFSATIKIINGKLECTDIEDETKAMLDCNSKAQVLKNIARHQNFKEILTLMGFTTEDIPHCTETCVPWMATSPDKCYDNNNEIADLINNACGWANPTPPPTPEPPTPPPTPEPPTPPPTSATMPLPDPDNHNTTYVVQEGDTCSDLKLSLCENTVFCSDKCNSDNNIKAGDLIEYNCTGTCNKLLNTKRFIVDFEKKTIDGEQLDSCYYIVKALCPKANPNDYKNIICKATEPGPQTCSGINANARIYYNCDSTSYFNDCPNSFNNNYGTYIAKDGDTCTTIIEDKCGPGTGTRVTYTNAICKKTFEENSDNYNPNDEKSKFCSHLQPGDKVYYDCSTLGQHETYSIKDNKDGDRCPATTAPTPS